MRDAKQIFNDGSEFTGTIYSGFSPNIKVGIIETPHKMRYEGQFKDITNWKHGVVKTIFPDGKVEFDRFYED